MTHWIVIAQLPWSELLPMPDAILAFLASVAASFAYGYRHPKGY